MRGLLGCGLAVALAAAAAGQDQKDPPADAKALVGKWEPADPLPPGTRVTVEFTAGAKFVWLGVAAGKTEKVEGTYTLDGTRLTVTMKVGDKDRTEVRTVLKLADGELTTADARGAKETLRRAK